jgi:hypothetical protein
VIAWIVRRLVAKVDIPRCTTIGLGGIEEPMTKPLQKNLFELPRPTAKPRRRKPPEEETTRDATPLSTDPHFAGEYNKTLMGRVKHVLSTEGGWWSVQRLAPVVHGTETATSSACRDLRKKKNGAHIIERRRIEKQVSEYRWVS